jgi:hypothetical protein
MELSKPLDNEWANSIIWLKDLSYVSGVLSPIKISVWSKLRIDFA